MSLHRSQFQSPLRAPARIPMWPHFLWALYLEHSVNWNYPTRSLWMEWKLELLMAMQSEKESVVMSESLLDMRSDDDLVPRKEGEWGEWREWPWVVMKV